MVRRLALRTMLLGGLLAPTSAANAVAPTPATTTPLEFVQTYLNELRTLSDLRVQALKDQKGGTDQFVSCIGSMEAQNLELRADIASLRAMHVKDGYDDLDTTPAAIAEFLSQKVQVNTAFQANCEAFVGEPKPGVDYNTLVVQAPKLAAQSNYIEKGLFQASALVFMTLLSPKTDSHGHANHMVISRAERDSLIDQIKIGFGSRLNADNQTYEVSTAKIILDKLVEFKAADEPWE